MPDLIERYWEPDSALTQNALQVGAVFLAPIAYVDEELLVLNVTWVDPLHKKPPKFQLGSRNQSTFDHQPVKESLNLEYNEGLIVHKAKMRPVILFSVTSRTRASASGRVPDGAILCLPVYGLDQFPREFALSVKAFKYVNRFYLPGDSQSHIEEGMIQFDRAQMVHVTQLQRYRPPTRMTPDALYVLQEWFRYYTTGSCDSLLLDHQAIELEKLNSVLTQSNPGS